MSLRVLTSPLWWDVWELACLMVFLGCLLGVCLPCLPAPCPALLLLAVLPAQVEGSSMCLGPAMGDCDHNWSGTHMP
jgi:hypothetical protein